MSEDTKQYQIVMVFPPILEPKQLEQIIGKIKQIITGYQGSFSEEKTASEPQLKKLSYPINKYKEAFYLTLNFSLPPQAIEEINKQLNLENDLIRYVITAYDETKIQPEQATDYSKMVEKIEPLSIPRKDEPEPILKPKDDLEAIPKKKTPVRKSTKAELEDLDKKLEEILNN